MAAECLQPEPVVAFSEDSPEEKSSSDNQGRMLAVS